MDDAYQRGMAVRRQVLGDEHVDRATAAADEFTADFQAFITRYAWGGVWASDALDRRTRSLITISILAGLGREAELELHVRAAVRGGVAASEIRQALLHVAVYAGVPAANTAFAVAQRVLRGH
jgi:4-carboxymuconolactone decarboxylase